MRFSKTLPRRRLLRSILTGVAALHTVAITSAFSKIRVGKPDTQRRQLALRALISQLSPGAGIGQIYLTQHPEEASVEHLGKILFGDGKQGSISSMQARILDAEQEDFIAGRLVSLNGWMMSRTSLRVAALAALTVDRRLS